MKLIKLSEELRRVTNVWHVLLECPIESEVEIAHEEIDVCDGVRLDHVLLAEEPNVLQDTLRHRQSLIHSVLT